MSDMPSPSQGTQPTPVSAQERAYSAWKLRWEEVKEELECWRVHFKAPWDICGDAMAILARRNRLEVQRWCHDPPRHVVYFACPYSDLENVGLAFRSTGVEDVKICRAQVDEWKGAK